jgi:hypothetical protein
MTYVGGYQPSVTDVLLLDVARKVQLTPTDYDLAVTRYRAINDWLDRDDSPLKGKIALMYPQGSMATFSTISSSLENDDFDIDLMSELIPEFRSWHPRDILDLYYTALNGEPGSRYHGKVARNTRCVTVHYANMHLDVTPANLIAGRPARVSHIFHSKRERPRSEDARIVANPWGFAEWFKDQLPDAPGSAVSLAVLAKRADAVPVEEQPKLFERSLPLVAFQLIKRWRNKKYDRRQGRCPPSVLLACLVGERSGFLLRSGRVFASLYEVLKDLTGYIRAEFEKARVRGVLLERLNPACPDDERLTDRWPGSNPDQELFVNDLDDFRVKLSALGDPNLALHARNELLADMFGERAARLAVEEFQRRFDEQAHRGSILQRPGTGSVLAAPALGSIVTPRPAAASVQQAPAHKFFGSDGG